MMWHLRTNRGRVVYDRPRNVFNYRDAARILRSSYDVYEGKHPGDVYFAFAWAVLNLHRRVQEFLYDIYQTARAAAPELFPFPAIIESLFEAIKQLAREWISRNGPISWRSYRSLFPGDVNPWTGEHPEESVPFGADPDLYLSTLVRVRADIDQFLKEVGYGKAD